MLSNFLHVPAMWVVAEWWFVCNAFRARCEPVHGRSTAASMLQTVLKTLHTQITTHIAKTINER